MKFKNFDFNLTISKKRFSKKVINCTNVCSPHKKLKPFYSKFNYKLTGETRVEVSIDIKKLQSEYKFKKESIFRNPISSHEIILAIHS